MAGGFETEAELVEAVDDQSRMGLASRPEVVLHPEVEAHRPVTEPATATRRQGLWLGDPSQTQETAVEPVGRILGLGAGRHRQLHVIDAHQVHVSTVTGVPAGHTGPVIRRVVIGLAVIVAVLAAGSAPAAATWSLVATDPETGEVGVAIASLCPGRGDR